MRRFYPYRREQTANYFQMAKDAGYKYGLMAIREEALVGEEAAAGEAAEPEPQRAVFMEAAPSAARGAGGGGKGKAKRRTKGKKTGLENPVRGLRQPWLSVFGPHAPKEREAFVLSREHSPAVSID